MSEWNKQATCAAQIAGKRQDGAFNSQLATPAPDGKPVSDAPVDVRASESKP